MAVDRNTSKPNAVAQATGVSHTANPQEAKAAMAVATTNASSIAGLPPGCQRTASRMARPTNASVATLYDQTPGFAIQLLLTGYLVAGTIRHPHINARLLLAAHSCRAPPHRFLPRAARQPDIIAR